MTESPAPRIALYTFGLLRAPLGSELLNDFVATTPSVFGQAEQADGFIAHAAQSRPLLEDGRDRDTDRGLWGVFVPPRFYRGSMKPGEVSMIATLSLWRDVPAARKYVYSGMHRDALRRRDSWFQKHDFRGYVMWWVAGDAVPTWAEGAEKLEVITDEGPTALAFDFANAYDAAGGSSCHR